MSLPYTNDDVMRAHHLNVRFYNMRNRVRWYICNLTDSTKNAAKLLGAAVASCIHGVFPRLFKYTAIAVCLSVVEHDLTHNKLPSIDRVSSANAHLHDV